MRLYRWDLLSLTLLLSASPGLALASGSAAQPGGADPCDLRLQLPSGTRPSFEASARQVGTGADLLIFSPGVRQRLNRLSVGFLSEVAERSVITRFPSIEEVIKRFQDPKSHPEKIFEDLTRELGNVEILDPREQIRLQKLLAEVEAELAKKQVLAVPQQILEIARRMAGQGKLITWQHLMAAFQKAADEVERRLGDHQGSSANWKPARNPGDPLPDNVTFGDFFSPDARDSENQHRIFAALRRLYHSPEFAELLPVASSNVDPGLAFETRDLLSMVEIDQIFDAIAAKAWFFELDFMLIAQLNSTDSEFGSLLASALAPGKSSEVDQRIEALKIVHANIEAKLAIRRQNLKQKKLEHLGAK